MTERLTWNGRLAVITFILVFVHAALGNNWSVLLNFFCALVCGSSHYNEQRFTDDR